MKEVEAFYMEAVEKHGLEPRMDLLKKVHADAVALVGAMMEKEKYGYVVLEMHDGLHYFVRADGEEGTCFVSFLTIEELELLGYASRNAYYSSDKEREVDHESHNEDTDSSS